MKSKLTTYLLVIAVAVLWGIIIKRVFFSKPPTTVQQYTEVKSVVSEKSFEPLMLNYRDPFRPAPQPKATVVKKEIAAPEVKKQTRKENVSLKFIGRLQCGDAVNYIIELNGQQHTLSHGEEAGGFTLSRICSDSLYFTRKEAVYSLALE